MVVSEEQAKKKMCPIRANRSNGGGRDFGPNTCVASDCMMWKWVMEHRGDHPFTMVQSRDQGYCGLTFNNGY